MLPLNSTSYCFYNHAFLKNWGHQATHLKVTVSYLITFNFCTEFNNYMSKQIDRGNANISFPWLFRNHLTSFCGNNNINPQ